MENIDKPQSNINSPASSTSIINNNNEGEQIITELVLAGIKVLMVRKRDQIVYKLPDNMQVSSISEEQRKRLMEEIQSLHAATMLAAQQQANMPVDNNKLIAPKTEAFALNIPPQPTPAEVDAIKETARKLREELEQQQQSMILQQKYQQGMINQTPNSYEASPSPDIKGPRKYNKTGKYSKKKQHHQQQQQSTILNMHQQPLSQAFTPQQFAALQQSFQNTTNNSNVKSSDQSASATSTPATSSSLPTGASTSTFTSNLQPQPVQFQTQQSQMQKPLAAAPTKQETKKFSQPLPDSILSKRLPEEEYQHREIKRSSTKDAIDRLLPYHIYHYPKTDLVANKVSVELQDTTILDIFKCQLDVFKKHQKLNKRLEKSDETLSMKILIGRQIMADQRQKLTEEQARISAEQAAQATIRKEQQRIQAEQAQLAAFVGQQLPPGFDTTGMF
ncbi:hypothetical protein G6F37_003157 [Rhizopus arrhizus]|nr:hypothetical protein G6F38_003301 [Rhizopus arrhizus]KAG1161344.1 hypothetical protein G6F37_003157 [Rhizopus arrhizus]